MKYKQKKNKKKPGENKTKQKIKQNETKQKNRLVFYKLPNKYHSLKHLFLFLDI